MQLQSGWAHVSCFRLSMFSPNLGQIRLLTRFFSFFPSFLLGDRFEQRLHVLRVLFLFGEEALHQSPAGRIIVREVSDNFRVGLDGDSFRDQIFPDHVDETLPLHVFGVAAGQQAIGIEVRLAIDRKSTRLNSSHLGISYAVFCLKKKKTYIRDTLWYA